MLSPKIAKARLVTNPLAGRRPAEDLRTTCCPWLSVKIALKDPGPLPHGAD